MSWPTKTLKFLFEKVLKDVLYTKLELIDFIGDTQKLETYKEIAKSQLSASELGGVK